MSGPDYSKVWSSNSTLTPYEFSDADYLKGWEVVGSVPPARTQFDAIQRNNDLKTKDLNDRVTVVETGTSSSQRQASTPYQVNDIAYHSDLPTGWYLECTIAGTTGATDLEISTPVINDTVSDGSVTWTIRRMGSGGDGFQVGDLKLIGYNDTIEDGWFLCDGSAPSRTTYAELFAKIGTTYGDGDGTTTFNLPNYIDNFAQGSVTAGTVKSAGLPNIKGDFGIISREAGGYGSGAFYHSYSSYGSYAGNGNTTVRNNVTFAASRSSSVYSDSVTTVQPPALTCRVLIKYE